MGFILIGVYFCILPDIFVVGNASVTERIENAVTAPLNNMHKSMPEKNLRIAFLTDGLFSDAGWGAPMQQEGTYVLGVLAASMSKTGVIGFVGGEKYPNLINIYEGYKKGAQDINPAVQVLVTFLDDWDNSTKGKIAANSQIDKGADVLLQVADTSGYGVIEAAKEKGVYALGAISDQNKLAPETVLTSFVLDDKKTFDQIIKSIQNGNFTGQIFKPGLESEKGSSGDGIVYIAPFYSLEHVVPNNVKLQLEQLKEDIINGKIKIPEKYSNLDGKPSHK
jgi:basic membrane protein A